MAFGSKVCRCAAGNPTVRAAGAQRGMRLYHFTSLGHLPVILATGGLWRGEVPVGSTGASLRATWLTTDPDPAGHGLDGSSADKRAVRIAVDIAEDDVGLEHWLTFTKGKLSKDNIRYLVHTGGGMAKASTWYVYPAQIPPEAFQAVELRREDGGYSPATPEEIAAAVPHEGLHEGVVEDFRGAHENPSAY